MKARADVVQVVEYLHRFDVPFSASRDWPVGEIGGLSGRRRSLFARLAFLAHSREGGVEILAGTCGRCLCRSDMSFGFRRLSVCLSRDTQNKINADQSG